MLYSAVLCCAASQGCCWYVQFATSSGVPRQEVGGLAPGVGPPLTSYPIIPRSQHDNPFIGPIGKLPAPPPTHTAIPDCEWYKVA